MNVLDNIYGKINYKTYDVINKSSLSTALGGIISKLLFTNPDSLIEVLLPYTVSYALFNYILNNGTRTKD